jgi:aminoacyl tRNA synthase complex-interacting multifunctional protein 1
LTRYFDHIQSRPPVRESAAAVSPAFEPIVFDLENAPKIERKAELPKKKEKNTKQTIEATPTEKVRVSAATGQTAEKKEKKPKEAKEPTDGSQKKKPANAGAKVTQPEDTGEPIPSMIDLRVGYIVDGQYTSLLPPALLHQHSQLSSILTRTAFI